MKNTFFNAEKTGMLLKIILLTALSVCLLAAVGYTNITKISDIKTDSSKYEGKTITVKGTVGESIWLAAAERGTYQIGDGSDTIWVISTQPPAKGTSITTAGTVQSAFTILGQSYGTVIKETKRH